MPPKKGTSTPNKPPENPTWTLDEGEEMRRDINDLQKKIVTKDELQEMMEGLKGEIMEVLKNFVTEKTPESENASHEIHDEDTRKVNQEWRNSNFGLKTNHVPKIDMRKFDGKDPITWILQMEQFFDLHNVPHTQKVRIASLYLEPNQFVWYRWLCSRKSLVTWTIFTEEMIAHYGDKRSNTFFIQLVDLKQKGSVTEHIENFQRLNIKVIDIPTEHLIDVFIGTLKDNIQHGVLLWKPKSLENAFKVERNVESKNMAMATRSNNPNIYRENNAPYSKTTQPTRLTPQQLEERKEKGLCFNCDSNLMLTYRPSGRDLLTGSFFNPLQVAESTLLDSLLELYFQINPQVPFKARNLMSSRVMTPTLPPLILQYPKCPYGYGSSSVRLFLVRPSARLSTSFFCHSHLREFQRRSFDLLPHELPRREKSMEC
jgi:gas vesicle protein